MPERLTALGAYARIWRLYMAGSAHGFDRGRLAVYQTLLVKPDDNGRAGLPLTRRDWYEPVQISEGKNGRAPLESDGVMEACTP